MTEWILIGLGVMLWLFSILLLGAFCSMTEEKPRPLLRRRPNIKLVNRDENEAA